MPMKPFYAHFPELAWKETRTVTVRGHPELPDDEYGFLELYCDEPGCDCRRVLIVVLSRALGRQLATINFGWASRRYYARWVRNKDLVDSCRGAWLDPLGTQSEYSTALLGLFQTVVKDQEYVRRLKRHYALFKFAVEEGRINADDSSGSPACSTRQGE